MAYFVFNAGADGLTDGSIDWTADTIKARLTLSSVTPNKDDDVMTGYTGVGSDQTLSGTTRAKDDATDRIKYDANDPVFTAVTTGSTVGTVTIYKFVTNDGDSIPIASLDITDTPTNGGDITIQMNAAGVFYLQQ